jgi:FixJ family two-component response regulator
MSPGDPVVFVVDDDLMVLRAITCLLESAGYIVEAFSSARDFLKREPHSGFGCLIVDLRMPEITGLGLLEALRRADNTLSVIFLSGFGDVSSAVKAMKAGAFDFLTKPVDEQKLFQTIAEAVKKSGEARQVQREKKELRRRFARLTPREREVCGFVVRGLPNKQIAGELGIVEKTIKLHRSRVMEKLEASSLVELVRIVDGTDEGM